MLPRYFTKGLFVSVFFLFVLSASMPSFSEIDSANITVIKATSGGDDAFNFSWDSTGNPGPNNFSIITTSGSGANDGTGGNPDVIVVSTGLGDTDFSIRETLQAGWDFESASCVGATNNGNSNSNINVFSVDGIELNAGDNVVCTFINRKQGTVNIVKKTEGGDDTFGFETTLPDGPAQFTLTTSAGTSPTESRSVPVGQYTIDETNIPAGWQFTQVQDSADTALQCTESGGDSIANTVVLGSLILLNVEYGETISCTYLNTKQQLYDLYTCGGATFADGYTATVRLDEPWEGHTFQGEDDVDGTCKNKKADGFACTGSGNLITSRINDDVVMKAFTNPTHEQDLGLPANSGDPTFAVVHAGIFIPGDCAEVAGICNHDSDDGSTAEQDCYDSGFSGGPSPEGWWGTAEESCTEAAANTDEGMFAEGTPFSSGRPKPGKNRHKSWAMYAELKATCDTGIQFVPTGDEQLCDSAGFSVLAVADGGNWPDSFLDVGDVIFTPDTDCTATELCSGVDSQTTCP